jgi:hypothetical protein
VPLLSYLLPLRWADDSDAVDLTAYLRTLRALPQIGEIIVVDASAPDLFARHAAEWSRLVSHVRPDPHLRFANGKVNGVLTGMRHAAHDLMVIADDDVRYDAAALTAVRRLLAGADLVRPQNYFEPTPWWACWDTARSLLNRAVAADYPGTFGVRRSALDAAGGYDGDVVFENLELIRTIRARGGTETLAPEIFVARRPCSLQRFLRQRLQQAYDDLAQPARLALFLAVLPALLLARRRAVLAAAATVVALAEHGRRRDGGAAVFPATAALLAPCWVLERAVFSWAAVATRLLRGGLRYRDRRIKVAAHSVRRLRRAGFAGPGLASSCACRHRRA